MAINIGQPDIVSMLQLNVTVRALNYSVLACTVLKLPGQSSGPILPGYQAATITCNTGTMSAMFKQLTFYLGEDNTRTSLVAGAALLISAYVVHLLTTKTYKLPPGPRPWPIAGNMPTLMKCNDYFGYFDSLRQKYGDVFTLYFGSEPTVMINGKDIIKEAFVQKGNDFAGRPSSYTLDITTRGRKDIFGGSFGPVWHMQRQIMHASIRKYASGRHLEEQLQKAMEVLTKYLTEKSECGSVDPFAATTLLVYNIICNVTFGTSYDSEDPEFLQLTATIDKINEVSGNFAADFFPILRFVPTPAQRTLKRSMTALQNSILKHWEEHNQTYDAGAVTDLVYHVIEQRNKLRDSAGNQDVLAQVTEEHFLELISDFFFAATDTSRYTLLWVILYMATYPDIQRKMQDEIDSAVGDRPIILSDKQNLPYTEAVLHEAMRNRPIFPLFVHRTTCETSVGGYTLPAKQNVFANVLSLHMDPIAFPEPHEFKPERFLDENGKFMVRPGEWMPFSTGRRVCVGEALAKSELHMLTAMIFQRFTFAPEDGRDVDLSYLNDGISMFPNIQKVTVNNRK